MFGKHVELNAQTLAFVEEIGRHMPGGFFIYKAAQPEELLYANKACFTIFGCDDLEEFKALTGYTFKGMLYPEDYRAISDSILQQIDASEDNMDYVEYRIDPLGGRLRPLYGDRGLRRRLLRLHFGHHPETGPAGAGQSCAGRRDRDPHHRLQHRLAHQRRGDGGMFPVPYGHERHPRGGHPQRPEPREIHGDEDGIRGHHGGGGGPGAHAGADLPPLHPGAVLPA